MHSTFQPDESKPHNQSCVRLKERGVAHIVEHLAFNATEEFENHAIIKFLESIGAEFGACSNAYTS